MKLRCSSQERCLHVEGSPLDTPAQGLECCEAESHWEKSIGSPDIQNQELPRIDLQTLKELKELVEGRITQPNMSIFSMVFLRQSDGQMVIGKDLLSNRHKGLVSTCEGPPRGV